MTSINNKASPTLTHQDFVFGELQLLHGDHVFTVDCCLQGSLVDQIFQVSTGEADGASGDHIGLNSCREETKQQVSADDVKLFTLSRRSEAPF